MQSEHSYLRLELSVVRDVSMCQTLAIFFPPHMDLLQRRRISNRRFRNGVCAKLGDK